MCVHAFEGAHRIILIPVPSATAVIFFFVLSGTVMGLTHHDDRPGWASSLLFLLHRVLRIYPLYWVILAITLLTWPFLMNHSLLLNCIMLIPNAQPIHDIIPVAWTLHWEMFFYLIFALYILLARKNVIFLAWFAAIIVFNIFIKLPAIPESPGSFMALITNPIGLFFLAGIFVSAIIQKNIMSARLARYTLGLGILVTGYAISQEYFGLYFPSTLTDTMIAALGMAGIIASLMVLEKSGQLFIHQWYLVLGKISYPMYISHWLLMELTFREFWLHNIDVTKHYMLYAAALTFVSLTGGITVTYLIDRPIQSFSRRILLAVP
jgi:peptidoglycan/LPS O-acetylase OafA/YrhL